MIYPIMCCKNLRSSIQGNQTTQSKRGRPKQIFLQRHTYRWPINTWKDAQYHSLLGKFKSKLQWGITSHHLEWTASKKSTKINTGVCGKKAMLLHCWWECKLIQPLWKIVWRFLKKTRNKTTTWLCNPTHRHILWGNQNWTRHIYPTVHCSTICKS